MQRISYKDVSTSLGLNNSYDIMNAIRNEASPQFQNYVPLANKENVAEVGAGIIATKALQNEFITALVERIGKVILRRVSLSNPLSKFKKGEMEYGRTIEEIFTDIADEHMYDPEVAESEVFKREVPDVKSLFHEVNREGFFKQTIQDGNLKRAFVSWEEFGDFTASIVAAMYNSDEVHEYRYMMMVVDNFYSKGLFKTEKTNPVIDKTSATDLVKQIRKHARKMTMTAGTRDYNSMAVHTRSEMDRLHLLITADLEAEMDVEVLASAFNMDKTDFLGKVTIVDKFASPGLEAVLIDEDWFMVYDVNLSMEVIRNPQGLYWNYFLHHHQIQSASRFAPAVAFTTDENAAPVTTVILDPQKASIKQGGTMKFNAYVRQTDDVKREIVWDVKTTGSETKRVATTVKDGELVVADNQEGELMVTATVSYDTEVEDGDGSTTTETTDIVGSSIVHVKIPIQ